MLGHCSSIVASRIWSASWRNLCNPTNFWACRWESSTLVIWSEIHLYSVIQYASERVLVVSSWTHSGFSACCSLAWRYFGYIRDDIWYIILQKNYWYCISSRMGVYLCISEASDRIDKTFTWICRILSMLVLCLVASSRSVISTPSSLRPCRP